MCYLGAYVYAIGGRGKKNTTNQLKSMYKRLWNWKGRCIKIMRTIPSQNESMVINSRFNNIAMHLLSNNLYEQSLCLCVSQFFCSK